MRKALQKTFALTALASSLLFAGCSEPQSPQSTTQETAPELLVDNSRLGIYHQVPLTADLSRWSESNGAVSRALCDGCCAPSYLAFWRFSAWANLARMAS